MLKTYFILTVLISSFASAQELPSRFDYDLTFKYNFTLVKSSKMKFRIKGWSLAYRDAGLRGMKPFTITGTILDNSTQTGDKAVIQTQIQAEVETESQYWGKKHFPIKCDGKASMELNLIGMRMNFSSSGFKDGCEMMNSVSKQLLNLAYAPIYFPPEEKENSTGPEMPTKPQDVSFLERLFGLSEGSLQYSMNFQRAFNKGDQKVLGLDVIGKINGKVETNVYGLVEFNNNTKRVETLIMNYQFNRPLIFPQDVGKLSFVSFEINQI